MKNCSVGILHFVRWEVFQKFRISLIVSISVWLVFECQLSFAQHAISCGVNKVLICHKGKNTLCVSENAVQAHLNHGDHLGSCSGDECGVEVTGGEITCTNISLTLLAVSNTSGVTYSWTGPNNFTSTLNAPTITVPGAYIVTVTNTEKGCSATDTAIVTENITPPAGVTATNNGPLTCIKMNVTLTGSSATTGVTYKWIGPGSFTSTSAVTSITTQGTYSLTVMNPITGCTDTTSTIVTQNSAAPEVNAIGGNLTCTKTSVILTGSSTTPGVTYSWSGPGNFTSSAQNPTVSTTGIYTLTVTNPANGCIASDTAIVSQNTTIPGATAGGGDLTCVNPSIILSGSSVTPGVTYHWSGPGGFTSNLQNPNVSALGTYALMVTNPANGCTSVATAEVTQNKAAPGASSNVNGILTCNRTAVILLGNSGTSGVIYSWSGPLTFASTEQNPVTSSPGIYTLLVTNPSNGCSSTSNTLVIQDTSTARGVNVLVSSSLNCIVKSVILAGSSTTSGVTYSWTGPNGFWSTDQSLTVSTPGNYVFHVCKPSNGCIALANVLVPLDTIKPKGVIASSSGILSCTASSVMLTGYSSTTGVSYSWMGPGFTSTQAITSVTNPGTYTLTVTDHVNGCDTVKTLTIVKDLTPPAGVTLSVSGTLTCTNQNVTISVLSSTPDLVYSWIGPGSYTSNERTSNVSNPGAYSVTVTNPYNDCSVTRSLEIQQNITAPEGVLASATGILNCNNHTISLRSSSTTSSVTYNWAGPEGFTSSIQNPIVSQAGTYTLTVTSTANGCNTVMSVPVEKDTVPPQNVTTSVSGTINCVDVFVMLTGSSTTPGAEYIWTSPDNVEYPDDISYAITPGVYWLKVTNPDNGCKDSANIMVVLDTTPPVSHIIPPDRPPVASTNNVLSAQIVNNVTYLWTFSFPNPNWAVVSGDTTSDLTYLAGNAGTNATFFLTVIGNQNGCFSTSQIILTAESSLKSAREITNGIGKNENEFQIKTYPNPFSNKAIIEFTPVESGQVTIDIYSIDGSFHIKLFNGEVIASHLYQFVIDSEIMKSGIYYWVLRSNNKILYNSKLIKIN